MSNKLSLAALATGVILVGAGCTSSQSIQTQNNQPPPGSDNNVIVPPATSTIEQPVVPTSTPTSSESTSVKKPSIASISATLKYVDALALYRTSGFYFQFSKCHGTPGVLTVKSGTKLMLDNRDNTVRNIKIGSSAFSLGRYGFQIISANQGIGVHYITCDGGGSAKLTIQK